MDNEFNVFQEPTKGEGVWIILVLPKLISRRSFENTKIWNAPQIHGKMLNAKSFKCQTDFPIWRYQP